MNKVSAQTALSGRSRRSSRSSRSSSPFLAPLAKEIENGKNRDSGNYDGFVVAEDLEADIPIKDPSDSSTELVWKKTGARVTEATPGATIKRLLDSKQNKNSPFKYSPIVYRGNPDDGTLFVYIGDRAENVLKNAYIRLEDLKDRLGGKPRDLFDQDWNACFSGDARHLATWDRYGELKPSLDFLRALFSVDTTKYIGEPVNKQQAFQKYCNVAYYAVLTPRDPFSVKTRFWDKTPTPSPNVVFRIVASSEHAKKILGRVLNEMNNDEELKLKFKPSSWNFIDENKAKELKLIGCHPEGHYSIYVTQTHLAKMDGLQNEPHKIPDLKAIQEVNDQLYSSKNPTQNGTPSVTKSTITKQSLDNASTNNKRVKTQAQVMNYMSASTVASILWDMKYTKGLAEWLHRSAYSFGGLDGPNGFNAGVDSSQDMKNLVFGTVETNTLMIRFEEYIKRLADLDETIDLTTTLSYPKGWPSSKKRAWLTTKLDYDARFRTDRTIACKTSFYPFARLLLSRFEFELDERFDKEMEILNDNTKTAMRSSVPTKPVILGGANQDCI